MNIAISPAEAADRLAMRELVEPYAHCGDRRDARGQMSLFTMDTHFVASMDAKDPKPSQELRSREALAPVFAELNKYDATTHFVGQSTILTLTANRATGEAYCLAHQRFDREWKAKIDARLASLPRHVREDSRRLVCSPAKIDGRTTRGRG